ncbi:MAG TPA: phosphoribosylanthranilate isomerase, partial [Bacteroidota bacterium]
LEDACAAAELGADALGFVFYRGSRRAISAEGAAAIIAALPPFVTPVGVFADAPFPEILRTAEQAGICCLQLHGTIELPEAVPPALQLVRAFRTSPHFDPAAALSCRAMAVLVDGYSERAPGGTGTVADWKTAATIARSRRLILSGGLCAANVGEAIRTVRPWAVDVSSGVETSPGLKDRVLMERFIGAVRSVPEDAGSNLVP